MQITSWVYKVSRSLAGFIKGNRKLIETHKPKITVVLIRRTMVKLLSKLNE